MKTVAAALALAFALCACGDEGDFGGKPASPDDVPAAAAGAASAKPAPIQTPYEAPGGAQLALSPPPAWSTAEPGGASIVARYRVARAAGDAEDADVTVAYFGAQGKGPLQTNLLRWAKQFATPPGGDPLKALTQSQRRVGEFDVSECEVSGTYLAEEPPGSGNKLEKPDWSLMGAIVQTPAGPYYLRLLGPRNTVAEHAAEFREFVSGLR